MMDFIAQHEIGNKQDAVLSNNKAPPKAQAEQTFATSSGMQHFEAISDNESPEKVTADQGKQKRRGRPPKKKGMV